MDIKDFNFDKYLKYREEQESFLEKLNSGKYVGPILTQHEDGKAYLSDSCKKETSLSAWLENLDTHMKLHTDVGYYYLEPWCGVPVFADAFGAEIFWSGDTSAQSKPRYFSASEIENVPLPKPGEGMMMQMVMDYIRYFKEQTHNLIPISITDTQSPCDTASLILDPCELFALSLEEPEGLEDFMLKITQTIGDFTEMQMNEIGEDLLVRPGHTFISGKTSKGIALSDDNMAVISPASYAVLVVPYHEILSKRFGGLAIHSCGVFSHNVPQLIATTGIQQLNFKITDFEPNDPEFLASQFKETGITLEPCIYPDEDLERLLPLLRSDIKIIFNIFTSGTIDERNRQFDKVAQFVHDNWKTV